ncbi:unnamed protein product [Cylindrotheca closterium]|uniref:Protein kinase domain-containing protein n=1 Tax=Cylindrotheca closterium TaxID=2856 RepID=A0AAD2GB14_9STRA|nr:unnamed protein product [Cylindrotheca closterium]
MTSSQGNVEVADASSISEIGVDDFLAGLSDANGWSDETKKAQYSENLQVLANHLLELLSLEACARTGRDGPANEVNEIVAKILDPNFLDAPPSRKSKKLIIREWKETAAAQPILHAIIYRVLGLVDLRHLYVSKEQKTRGKNVNEKDRVMDFLVHEMREHIIHALPSMIEGVIEVKRCEKESKHDNQQINRAANQSVGNFAKRLRGELKYLVKASLQHVGTENVEVSLIKTKPVDLLSHSGLKLLARTLNASVNPSQVKHGDATLIEAELKLPSYGSEDKLTKISIGEILGSGAFGIVYQVTSVDSYSEDPKGYFIKIPTSCLAKTSLKDEAKILDELNKEKTGTNKVPNIPCCKAKGTFCLAFNGFVGETYGLLLNGMIDKAANSLDWNAECNKQHLPFVVEKVFAALKAAHDRGVYHLDIQPGNIIVSDKDISHDESPGDVGVLVIDWGVAIRGETDFSFRGCVQYAHNELLALDRTRSGPKEVYDWASLLYTYYHLHEGGLPWNALMEHGKRVCDTGMRENVVSDWWWKQKQDNENGKYGFVEAFAKVLPEQQIA